MKIDRFLTILGLLIGMESLIWTWINHSRINTISANQMGNVHQDSVVTYNSGPDISALIKITKELSQPKIDSIVQIITEMQKQIDAKPNVYYGTEEPPKNLKEGDLYFQYEE